MYAARTGEDLHKVLWLKSRNSEVWLERRTHYTRSCAVMSMVVSFCLLHVCNSLAGSCRHDVRLSVAGMASIVTKAQTRS